MKPEIVFAMYRPHEGKADELEAIIKTHHPMLLDIEFVTDRPPIIVKAKDGAFIEIFEWVSAEAAHKAHHHPVVAKVWEAMGAICDFATLESLAEAQTPFPHFTPVD